MNKVYIKENLEKEIALLNPQQREAVEHFLGPMLVLAGAGSGKTKVATLRIAHLISKGVQPSHILGVTFTNKAAHEMKERTRRYCGCDVLVSTFHSLGAKILRESAHHLGYTNDFAIYDEDDAEKLLKECAQKVLGPETKIEMKSLRAFISDAKNKLIPWDTNDHSRFDSLDDAQYIDIYKAYCKKLIECNACDFDDLLFLPVMIFRQFPEILASYQDRWPFVLVDEYQDTNFAQYTLVKMLVDRGRNLFVVGDPDQSIYSWRGACVQNILNFEHDYPGAKVIRLEQNYRSTRNILAAANAVIQNNQSRYEKNLWSTLGEGEKISVFAARSERQEAEFVAKSIQHISKKHSLSYSDIVVFYRTNFQSRVLEDELLFRKIPYIIVGGISFYLRKEIKDVLSYLKLLDNPKDLVSFMRIINLPKRGFGKAFLAKLVEFQESSGRTLVDLMKSCLADSFSGIPFSVSAKQKEGWVDFVRVMNLLEQKKQAGSLEELVKSAIYENGYIQTLDEEPETKAERKENLDELIVKAAEWESNAEEPTLSKFLEELSLTSSFEQQNVQEESITLMTVHNGKGLEYKAAFLIGLEEDLFPHINAKQDPWEIEEERRLFYVGITRAKQHLYMSCAATRSIWGSLRRMRPSRFLNEVPLPLRKTLLTIPSAYEFEEEHEEKIEYLFAKERSDSSISREKEPEEKQVFTVGQMVFHAQFGIGRIDVVSTGSLGVMYEVFFLKDSSRRKLVAQYAPLKSLDVENNGS